ncbi:hypothetical protein OG711_12955 [Streptomyces uncialis]|uniref:hypothetical protein n=1 Tax=Streptomyces uncialis TaxID=1048205 RepID=UPI002E3633AF|nr:hypothetical protein [Streptomyces uncialis]
MTGHDVRAPFGSTRVGRGSSVRLLPWSTPEGKPCYLVTDDGDGYLSRIADVRESTQLDMADQLLGHARALLSEPKAGARELRFVAARLVESLHDTLRVARSRGERLPSRAEPLDRHESNPDRRDDERPGEGR